MKPIRRFEIVELNEFDGSGATIYSIALNDDEETLYDRFLAEYNEQFPDELKDIVDRLYTIAELGARVNFFKENEGALGAGDGLVALFDIPGKNLRLYCIRFGTFALIIGGGGPKAKTIRALQEDPKLTAENYLLRTVSAQINQAIRDGEIWWEGNRLAGRLQFDDDND
ncbi:hypothetical protein [Larkinella sp. C7]|uniref:hypothetical protein n=1 Tax=Larkinella sp. C7 TaxID=2576607 RepID=UPI001E45C1BA|nr:hypothetical protein [Larkinella sp. C7]